MEMSDQSGKIKELTILLADDDLDDCLFFAEALEELKMGAKVATVNNGEQLMQLLQSDSSLLPDILFLDLNMPRKNGVSCLEEIKQDDKLSKLPVIILSTSVDRNIADQLYRNGAQHYICKPADFSQLKKVIQQAISLTCFHKLNQVVQPPKEHFFLRAI